jgi:hypothetical protein
MKNRVVIRYSIILSFFFSRARESRYGVAQFQKIYDSVEGRGIIREGVFFEGLGVLVREELIDVRLVSLFLYGEVKLF